jgi:hypothetical protein
MLAAVALVIALPACGGGADEPSKTPSARDTPPRSRELLPGSTPPGTRLRFGQKAILINGVGANRVRTSITVTGVDRGTAEDIAALRHVLQNQGFQRTVPYFVRSTFVNEDGGGDGWGSHAGPSFRGETKSGSDAGSYDVLGRQVTLPHCVLGTSPGRNFSVKGARHSFCHVRFATPGNPVTKVGIQVAGGKPDITWE